MIYAVSDLHGYSLEKFKSYLEQINFTDKDFLYVLGDVIDRGSDGIKILKWLMATPNARLILGNHESMMLSCEFIFETSVASSFNRLTEEKIMHYQVWMSNGGNKTLDVLEGMRDTEIKYIFDYLKKAPLYETVSAGGRDFLLVHSGLGNFSKGKELSQYTEHELLWTRPTPEDRYFDNITTVFGHTPTLFYGMENKGRAVKTDTWIDIDMGAGMGDAPMILRLDDMKEFYFDE